MTAVREKVPGESTGTVYEDAVVLAFLENTAYKRQTTLTITASDGTVLEVPVVQKGIYADAYVKAAPESLTFMAENPQPAAVAIDTNMDTFAAVSDSDWCTVVDNGDGTITVTCTEYGDNTADRTAEITVTAGARPTRAKPGRSFPSPSCARTSTATFTAAACPSTRPARSGVR